MTVRAALYTRVSTEDQAKEGFSLAAQLDNLRSYAKIHGWKIAGEYVDEGQSGRTIKRRQYQRMMDAKDSWDVLLVLKMDRVHRNSRNFMDMMDFLKTEGKEFASVMESLDTATAMGRFVADIICRIGQLESEQIGERVFVGMEQKAKSASGGLGGVAPYGYTWENGHLTIVPEEAKVVRLIFKIHRKEKISFTAIAMRLNQQGHRTRNRRGFSYWSVRDIIQNKVYEGHLVWNSIMQRDQHEALVET